MSTDRRPSKLTGTARRTGVIAGAALVATVVLQLTLLARPVAADDDPSLLGCRGSVVSHARDGTVLDEATGVPVDDVTDPGNRTAFSRDNPFVVRADGRVDWQGETDDVLVGGRWSLEVWGLTLTDGSADNRARARSGQGSLEMRDVVPTRVTGLVKVEGRLTAEGDDCTGAGWVRLDGDPTLSLPWLLGVGLLAGGIGLGFVAQPRQVWS